MNRTVAAVAALLLLTSCGGPSAEDVVRDTAENLEELRSGILELRVTAEPGATEGSEDVAGFELAGKFQLPDEGELPVADLRYTELGTDVSERGFVATGDAAFIEVDEQAYVLPPEQTRTLLGSTGGGNPLFADTSVEHWVEDAQLHEEDSLDGVEVDRVTGQLDVVAALNDLFALAQRFGGTAFSTIEGVEAERLSRAVESSRIEVVSGSEDRLLRRLLIEVDLALDDDLRIAEALGPLGAAGFTLDMSISEPNEPIEVEEPSDALPIEELPPPG